MNEQSGISISHQEFNKHLEIYSAEMQSERKDLSVEELTLMTRIWNTLEGQGLRNTDRTYNQFCTLYYPNYFKLAWEKTEATLSKGMVIYAAKYNLWLGGTPHPNSQFQIEN